MLKVIEGQNIFSSASETQSYSLKSLINYFTTSQNKMFLSSISFNCELWTISLSSNNSFIVLGCEDGSIRTINLQTKLEEYEIASHSKPVSILHLTKDNKRLISASQDGCIKIWDTEKFKEISTLNITPSTPNSLIPTPDGKFLAIGCSDGIIRVWPIEKLSKISLLKGHTESINSIATTSDGQYVATGSDDFSVRLWSLWLLQEQHTFLGHLSKVGTVTITSDNKFIVSGSEDKTVKIWNIKEKNQEFSFKGHSGEIYCLATSDDASLVASGGQDKTLNIWSIANRKLDFSCAENTGYVSCVKFLKSDKYVASGCYEKIILINIKEKRIELHFEGHRNFVMGIIVNNDLNVMYSISTDYTLKTWDLSEKSYINEFKGHGSCVTRARISYNCKLVITGSWDNTVKVWDLETFKEICTFFGHKDYVTRIEIDRECKMVYSGSWDSTVKVWDIEERKEVYCFLGHNSGIFSMAFCKNFTLLATGARDGLVICWNVKTRKKEIEINHKEYVLNLDFSNDSKYLITSSVDREAKVTNLLTHTVERTFSHEIGLTCIAISLSNLYLIAGLGNGKVHIWDMDNFSNDFFISLECSEIHFLHVTKDSKHLIVGSQCPYFYILSFPDVKEKISFNCNDTVTHMCIDFTENIIIAGCSNGKIILWNLIERRQEAVFHEHKGQIEDIFICANMEYFITSSKDKTAKLWGFDEILQTIMKKSDDSFEFDLIRENSSLNLETVSAVTENANRGQSSMFISCNPTMYFTGFRQRLSKRSFPVSSDCNMILPFGINLAHIYVILGLDKHLLQALYLGCPIRKDSSGNSPMHYAICKDSQKCIEAILDFLIYFSKEETEYHKYLEYSFALKDDIFDIIQNISAHVSDYLESMFRVIKDTNLPNFVHEFQVPLVISSPYPKVYFESFTKKAKKSKLKNKEVYVEFRATPIEFILSNGSKGGLKLLMAISNARNRKIFKTTFIQVLIDHKWNSMWKIIIFLTIIQWSNLIVTLGILFLEENIYILKLMSIVVNLVLLFPEIIQMIYTSPMNYFKYWRNRIDVTSSIINLTWQILMVFNISIALVKWFMVLLNFVRGLSGFRAFSSTRYYIRLIMSSISDVTPFLFIFTYSTIAFGALFSASNTNNDLSAFQILWKMPLELSLGLENNVQALGLEYAYFVLISVFNVIIMLNLLISILGNSFDQFQVEAVEVDYQEKLELIIEVQCLCMCFSNNKEKGYIQICEPVLKDDKKKTANRAEEIEFRDQITAKVNRIEKSVGQLEKSNKMINDKIDRLIDKLAKHAQIQM
ncbi:hypothetical protein SteCoe_33131 [Stentor coeruleus]|uniref:Uncharacterized protein n=1 Tax=Stentor coeruleus TaxID=5963 RepID=A0A1R2AXH1_9CILI|nr:hypothetical protein SteCoe_33131 [Stentor coeruleus]